MTTALVMLPGALVVLWLVLWAIVAACRRMPVLMAVCLTWCAILGPFAAYNWGAP